jgi:toxin ParE1/3/4
MSRIIKRRAAEHDLLEHFIFVGQTSERAARKFLKAAETTFELLASQPRMGRPAEWESSVLEDIRMFPIKGFVKYLVFYRPTSTGIEMVRVIHGARDIPPLFGN